MQLTDYIKEHVQFLIIYLYQTNETLLARGVQGSIKNKFSNYQKYKFQCHSLI